jgi:glycosyltransferase involved in cell wall biosynthesis
MLLPVLLPLRSDDTLRYVDDLTTYLRIERPRALLSALPYGNLAALTARRLARIPTRIVLTEHNVARNFEHCREWRKRFLRPLIARQYRFADRIVAVSNGVASDLSTSAGVLNDRIVTIYNPIVDQTLLTKAEEPLDHPWFAPGAPPVILGMGRLTPQKDFPTLIRAFARVRAARAVRLMILGAASSEAKTVKQRRKLETLAAGLGIADDVGFPGFVHNPMPYLVRAAVFVLSSAWEGFGNVLVEALACGCPVVSTDCPSGPAEILDNGRYARLVPVGDEAALAAAIVETLDNKPPSDALRQRAAVFSVERATARYAEVLGLERAATLQ